MPPHWNFEKSPQYPSSTAVQQYNSTAVQQHPSSTIGFLPAPQSDFLSSWHRGAPHQIFSPPGCTPVEMVTPTGAVRQGVIFIHKLLRRLESQHTHKIYLHSCISILLWISCHSDMITRLKIYSHKHAHRHTYTHTQIRTIHAYNKKNIFLFVYSHCTESHYVEKHSRNPNTPNPIKPKVDIFGLVSFRYNGKTFSV